MTDEQSAATGRLTDSQQTRVDYAHRDLEEARTEVLAQLDAANLVLVVERLRHRLDDILNLVAEVTPD